MCFYQNKKVQDFYSSHPGPINDTWNQQISKYFHPIFLFFEGFLFMFFSRQYGECPVGWWTMWGWWVGRKRFICHRKEHEGITLRRWLFLFITDGISYYPGLYLPSEVGHSAKRDRKIMGTFFVIFHRIIYQISHFILLPPLRLKRGRRYGQTGN